MAWLFMLGASCFALGAVPAYVHAVGAAADAITLIERGFPPDYRPQALL